MSAGGGHFVSGELKIDYNAGLDGVSAKFPSIISHIHKTLGVDLLLTVNKLFGRY